MSNMVNQDLARKLRAISTPLRLSILERLNSAQKTKTVCELARDLNTPQPTISNQLRALLREGIVSMERHHSNHYYFIRPESLQDVYCLVLRYASPQSA